MKEINKKYFRGFAGILILIGMVLSFTLQMMSNDIDGYFGRVLGFFSYFTEFANILVMLWFLNNSILNRKIKWLNKRSIKGAITLYICVAGLVFFLILNAEWKQTGIEKFQTYILHGFAPLAILFDWLILEKESNYEYKDILSWVVFPIVYLFWALAVGNVIGVYPYSFLDMNVLNLEGLVVNVFFLVIAFLMLSTAIVFIDKFRFKSKKATEINNISFR